MSLLAVAIVYLWLMPAHLFWLFPALTVWAFATDILWPSQQRRIVELAPERRGVALALTASFVFCGIGVGSAAAAWIYPRYGFAGLLCGSIMFLLLAVASLGVSVSARARRPAMCVN
jgi:DHA1 family inner membrane transport protein